MAAIAEHACDFCGGSSCMRVRSVCHKQLLMFPRGSNGRVHHSTNVTLSLQSGRLQVAN